MNTIAISHINFYGNIIDAHAHIGTINNKKYTKEDLDVFVKEKLPNNDNIEKIIVSDLDILHGKINEYDGNINLLTKFQNDSHYALLASCNPKNSNVKNLEKLFQEKSNNFIGLKFHPTIQKLNVNDNKYIPYIKFAEKHNLPCLFHSSVNIDNSGKLAKRFPKVRFVIAHLGAGWNEAHDKTINVIVSSIKNKDANLYADISWVDIDAKFKNNKSSKIHITNAIKKLKNLDQDNSYKLMFGTDAPLDRFKGQEAIKNYTKFIDEIKYAIKNDNDLKSNSYKIIDDLFYNNAKNLYLTNKKKKKDYKYIIITSCSILLGSIFYLLHKNKQKQSLTN